jgi:D-glycero-alpha-D-manno-heptose-7-phosphate kinase
MNIFTFHRNGNVSVDPVAYHPVTKRAVESRLLLFYTAMKRDASEILESQQDGSRLTRSTLEELTRLVPLLAEVFASAGDPRQVGEILHDAWMLKKSLPGSVSNTMIDSLYDAARAAGAIGGKLLGAGGGGFLLIYVDPDRQAAVRSALSGLFELRFRLDDAGSRITYYDER